MMGIILVGVIYCDEASAYFRDLGHRITAVTSEPRSLQFLLQRLSVQCGNAACVLGTVEASRGLEEIVYM